MEIRGIRSQIRPFLIKSTGPTPKYRQIVNYYKNKLSKKNLEMTPTVTLIIQIPTFLYF